MKYSFFKITLSAFFGCLIGAFVVMSFSQSEQAALTEEASTQEVLSETDDYTPLPVSQTPEAVLMTESDNGTKTQFANLTPASEKGVETVVHITTEFLREEITYDPFMKLFYGEEAYKTRIRRGMASGSGVLVSPEGHIVTNNHVVQDAEKITITIDGSEYEGKLVGTDPSTDLAVVKIEKKNLPYLEFANSDQLRLGEWVLAIGNPLNLQTTITAGIVSAKNRNIDLLTSNYDPEQNVFPVESFIQTDAAVNSGNSGGALVNQAGQLVGINTAIASGNGFYTGYSFAIPSNIVKKVTYDLIKYGEVKRVQLGVNILDNNDEVANEFSLNTSKGVMIVDVIPGGNGDRAKLKSGDVILKVSGNTVGSVNQLRAELAVFEPGSRVGLTIQRGGELKTIQMVMN